MKKQNVAYLRVSTEAQTEKYGLDMQRQEIMDYCEKRRIVIDKWYIDGGYSGSKLDRPEIQRLLDDVEKGCVGTVYIYKLDRMSRDVIDTLNLLYKVLPEFGVRVVSATEEIRTESPMDKVVITINAAMNQYEREVIRMRMSAGMVERVKNGYWMGGGRIPWGYYYDRNDGILHVDPEQAEMVRNAYRLYLDGYSCDRISNMLGFKDERIVSQILKRKSNIGLIEYKGHTYKGLHEPIVDTKTFYAVQEMIKRRSTNSYIANDHMLTGLCYCGICGARMRYHKWDGNHRLVCYSQVGGKKYMVRDENCCNMRPIARKVEQEVENCFRDFAINITKKEDAGSNSEVDMVESNIKKSTKKIKNLYSLYAENPSESLLDVIKDEECKISKLKFQLEIEKKKGKKKDTDKIERIKRISDVWDNLTNKEKNKILKECVEKIVITNADMDIHFVTF